MDPGVNLGAEAVASGAGGRRRSARRRHVLRAARAAPHHSLSAGSAARLGGLGDPAGRRALTRPPRARCGAHGTSAADEAAPRAEELSLTTGARARPRGSRLQSSDLRRTQLAPHAALDGTESHGTIGPAMQTGHEQAYGFAHAAHLTIAALVNRDLDQAASALGLEPAHASRLADDARLELDTITQSRQ